MEARRSSGHTQLGVPCRNRSRRVPRSPSRYLETQCTRRSAAVSNWGRCTVPTAPSPRCSATAIKVRAMLLRVDGLAPRPAQCSFEVRNATLSAHWPTCENPGKCTTSRATAAGCATRSSVIGAFVWAPVWSSAAETLWSDAASTPVCSVPWMAPMPRLLCAAALSAATTRTSRLTGQAPCSRPKSKHCVAHQRHCRRPRGRIDTAHRLAVLSFSRW